MVFECDARETTALRLGGVAIWHERPVPLPRRHRGGNPRNSGVATAARVIYINRAALCPVRVLVFERKQVEPAYSDLNRVNISFSICRKMYKCRPKYAIKCIKRATNDKGEKLWKYVYGLWSYRNVRLQLFVNYEFFREKQQKMQINVGVFFFRVLLELKTRL